MKRKDSFRSWVASVATVLALSAAGFWAALMPISALSSDTAMTCEGRPNSATLNRADVPASAVMLVANPAFEDPQWYRTVLLAAPLPNGGHVGVIVNRPTEITLAMLFPDHGPSRKVPGPVFYGGPFFIDALFAVIRSRDASGPDYFPLTQDLALATGRDAIDRIIERDPNSARYYVGVVVWRPGELDVELAKKLWSVCGASAEAVFRTDMEHLWKELSAATRRTRVSTPLPTHALLLAPQMP